MSPELPDKMTTLKCRLTQVMDICIVVYVGKWVVAIKADEMSACNQPLHVTFDTLCFTDIIPKTLQVYSGC